MSCSADGVPKNNLSGSSSLSMATLTIRLIRPQIDRYSLHVIGLLLKSFQFSTL